MKGSCRLGVDTFVMLAVDTRGDVAVLEVFPHVLPEIGMPNGVVCFPESKMTKGIVSQAKNILTYATVVRDDEALIQEPEVVNAGKIRHSRRG